MHLKNHLDFAAAPDSNEGGFFRRLDWSAFWTSALLSLVVYVCTMPPSVTLEDSGELAVAGDWLGVPHPPGYPIWSMLAWGFARVFSFVTFRGQPNPAWGITLLSAVCAALSVGMTAMLITRSGYDMLEDARNADTTDPPSAEQTAQQRKFDPLICWTAGVSASLILAFSHVMWSQSTIIEVYTLNALFLMLIFLLTYRWMRTPSRRIIWLTAFVFGLGLTNYQVLLLAALPLMIVILLKDTLLFRDFLLLGLPFLVGTVILKLGAMDPGTPGFPKHPALAGADSWGPALMPLGRYAGILVLLALVVAACAVSAGCQRFYRKKLWSRRALVVGGVLFVILLWVTLHQTPPPPPDPRIPANMTPAQWESLRFVWTPYVLGLLAVTGLLIAFGATFSGGLAYALAVSAIHWTLAILLYRGVLLGLTHPTSMWFAFYTVLNFVFLGLGALMLPRGITVSVTLLLFEAGVAFYAYMPIVSDLRNPPMNWGYPRTWEGFKHAITRGQYEKIAPTDIFSRRFLLQLGHYFSDLRVQFTLLIAPFGVIPFALWRIFGKRRKIINAIHIALVLFGIAVIFVAASRLPGLSEEVWRVDKFFLLLLLLLGLTGFVGMLTNQVQEFARHVTDRERDLGERLTAGLALAGLGMLIMAAFGYGLHALWSAGSKPPDAPSLAGLAWFVGPVMAGLLIVAVAMIMNILRRETGFRVYVDSVAQKWLIATMAGFVVMSVLLIILANPSGDIQDAFIQKVKFLSSHALFALWIGYGILFGLSLFVHRGGVRRLPLYMATGIVLLLPLIPIHQNYFNKELVRVFGGAEQNGHDFGWQFGNYQLRGARAILEELEPGEEPLPNPFYPPEMTPNAIFFGGTDPGRFVPTYMIFSARVRPDVFLITQNALADNTYMSVMRDLYGDDIWIPTPDDSARSFRIYVDEVESGKRPRNADLVVRDGRVQVSGALGVMEINGILCRMIFDHNKARHDFYVEESYVIPWMYPYFTPHGLIQKLNDEKTEISPENLRDDMDFWDWYVRRLEDNPAFRRDVAARKTFSKLRSAIAGTYAARRMYPQAEHAFRQSRILYPESPEATLRMVNEVYLPFQRHKDALPLLRRFKELDPNNSRIDQFVEFVSNTSHRIDQAREILQRTEGGKKMTPPLALELAGIYADLNNPSAVSATLKPLMQIKTLDGLFFYEAAMLLHKVGKSNEAVPYLDRAIETMPNAEGAQLLSMTRVYADARKPRKMLRPLQRYLRDHASDWEAWLDLATVYLMLDNVNEAQRAIKHAIQLGGGQAVSTIRGNRNLRKIGEAVIRGEAGNADMFFPGGR